MNFKGKDEIRNYLQFNYTHSPKEGSHNQWAYSQAVNGYGRERLGRFVDKWFGIYGPYATAKK